MVSENILISIIIIHYGNFEYLEKTLSSIFKNTAHLEKQIEIIIISNEFLIYCEQIKDIPAVLKEKIKIINSSKNLGYSGSINLGLQYSKGKYIIILNNDVEVSHGWLDALFECLMENNQIAGCQGKILSLANKHKFDVAGAAGAYIDKYGYTFLRGRIFDTIEEDIGQYDNETEVFWICGVCMAVKREIFDKIGGFDEDFFMYGEEIDWCWRAQLAGYKFLFTPKSKIYHIGSASTSKWKVQKKTYYFHRNHWVLLLKNTSTLKLFSIVPVKMILEFASVVYYLSKKNVKSAYAIFKSLCWVIVNFDSIWQKHNIVQSNRIVSDKIISQKLLNRSIAFLYFILGKKHYGELKLKTKR